MARGPGLDCGTPHAITYPTFIKINSLPPPLQSSLPLLPRSPPPQLQALPSAPSGPGCVPVLLLPPTARTIAPTKARTAVVGARALNRCCYQNWSQSRKEEQPCWLLLPTFEFAWSAGGEEGPPIIGGTR